MSNQDKVNDEMARTNGASFDFVGNLLNRVGKGEAVVNIVRKGLEKVQDGVKVAKETGMKLKEVASAVSESHDNVVSVVRKEFGSNAELNPAFSQDNLKAAFDSSEIGEEPAIEILAASPDSPSIDAEMVEDTKAAVLPEIIALNEKNPTMDAEVVDDLEIASSLEANSLPRLSEEPELTTDPWDEYKTGNPKNGSVPQQSTADNLYPVPWNNQRNSPESVNQPEKNNPSQNPVTETQQEPMHPAWQPPEPSGGNEKTQKEELLYGEKDGHIFSNMTTSDAIAVNAIMRGKVGDHVKGGENLLITSGTGSNKMVLFETDEKGFVTKNIYQENPRLLNDREALKSLGLQDLSTHTQFMAATQAEGSEVSRGQQNRESSNDLVEENTVNESIEKFTASTPPATEQRQTYSQGRSAAGVLSAFTEQRIESSLSEVGAEFGTVELADGSQLHKVQTENGYDISFGQQDGNDPIIFGSFDNDLGWAVSNDFSSGFAAAMDRELDQGQNNQAGSEQTPIVQAVPSATATQSNNQNQASELERHDD
jgi:hypothetical protein